jgi:dTDP-4-dehydrorhamnose 3,5-epimerase-like enzyme
MSLIRTLSLNSIGDGRGSLVSIEAHKTIPFSIERVYYLTNLNGHSRGFHAHKKLQQLVVCVHGSCRFVLDDGKRRESVVLDNPFTALLVGNMVWREMSDFKNDCVIMVLANAYYDESDYIRDYEAFLECV